MANRVELQPLRKGIGKLEGFGFFLLVFVFLVFGFFGFLVLKSRGSSISPATASFGPRGPKQMLER